MNKYQKYCVGCGLCESLQKDVLKKDSKGFLHPQKSSEFLKSVCPISGNHSMKLDKNNIWGRSEAVYLGWSNNIKLRTKASSGGILSEIAIYLLKNKKVDEIIHVGAELDNPISTQVYFSKTPEEVVTHCGSRYCISSPLSQMHILDNTKKYAFIGKPCDVVVLRNYMKIDPQIRKRITYVLSFFCMGIPSNEAQDRLLQELDCDDCKSLEYRGNGWPGFATAVDNTGNVHQITYDESWGKILGRDLMPACKLCIDGIGEMADIACGDAWFLTEDNKPDFSEHEGRNVIFARTSLGNDLLKEMASCDQITLSKYENYELELPLIQKSQWYRRAGMKARILAMSILFQKRPAYDYRLLTSYSQKLTLKNNFNEFLGTVKRILKRGL